MNVLVSLHLIYERPWRLLPILIKSNRLVSERWCYIFSQFAAFYLFQIKRPIRFINLPIKPRYVYRSGCTMGQNRVLLESQSAENNPGASGEV